MYDTTSGKSSLWVNHGKIRDFSCRLPLKANHVGLIKLLISMVLVALAVILKV